MGVEIETVYSNQDQKKGTLKIPYNFKHAPGLYLYHVKINNNVVTGKLIFNK